MRARGTVTIFPKMFFTCSGETLVFAMQNGPASLPPWSFIPAPATPTEVTSAAMTIKSSLRMSIPSPSRPRLPSRGAQREFIVFDGLIVRRTRQTNAGQKSSLGGDLVVPRSRDVRCGNEAVTRADRCRCLAELVARSPTAQSPLSSWRSPWGWVAPTLGARAHETGHARIRGSDSADWYYCAPNLVQTGSVDPAGERPLLRVLAAQSFPLGGDAAPALNATAVPGLDVLPVWGRTRGAGVTVAVVDTGVDRGSADLARTSCWAGTSTTVTTTPPTARATGR